MGGPATETRNPRAASRATKELDDRNDDSGWIVFALDCELLPIFAAFVSFCEPPGGMNKHQSPPINNPCSVFIEPQLGVPSKSTINNQQSTINNF
jgi:hypothetical protein